MAPKRLPKKRRLYMAARASLAFFFFYKDSTGVLVPANVSNLCLSVCLSVCLSLSHCRFLSLALALALSLSRSLSLARALFLSLSLPLHTPMHMPALKVETLNPIP